MNMIIALIRPNKWTAVKEALEQIEVERMTVADAIGFADSASSGIVSGSSVFDGVTSRISDSATDSASDVRRRVAMRSFPQILSQVVWLEIIVNDDFLEKTIDMIARVARTGCEGQMGDGKIFVVPVHNAVRARDGYSGKGAV